MRYSLGHIVGETIMKKKVFKVKSVKIGLFIKTKQFYLAKLVNLQSVFQVTMNGRKLANRMELKNRNFTSVWKGKNKKIVQAVNKT